MADLAPVYLDDARVQLQGDPRPKIAKIVAAGGKAGGRVRVVRLAAIGDESGEPMQLDDVIDRSQQRAPVYLRSFDDRDDRDGNKPRPGTQFGAGRPGMAGQGAKGSPGALPLDKQAKSDYDPDQRGQRNGASNQSYGVGDLSPGGRTGLTEQGRRTGVDKTILDGTQDFQSGGHQGEGGAPPYRDADVGSRGAAIEDEGVGAAGRRQAGRQRGLGSKEPAQGAQGGDIRDQSTDHAGKPQGQRPKRPSTLSGMPAGDAEAAD